MFSFIKTDNVNFSQDPSFKEKYGLSEYGSFFLSERSVPEEQEVEEQELEEQELAEQEVEEQEVVVVEVVQAGKGLITPLLQ